MRDLLHFISHPPWYHLFLFRAILLEAGKTHLKIGEFLFLSLPLTRAIIIIVTVHETFIWFLRALITSQVTHGAKKSLDKSLKKNTWCVCKKHISLIIEKKCTKKHCKPSLLHLLQSSGSSESPWSTGSTQTASSISPLTRVTSVKSENHYWNSISQYLLM